MEKYLELETLSQGSSSSILRVRHLETSEILALKKISKRSFKKMLKPKNQMEEIQILKSLDHPNIIKYIESFENEEYIFIIMEYAELDLNKLIRIREKQNLKFSNKEIYDFIKQIIEGIEYLHLKKILHRDIKPHNIFIKKGVIKVGDFGISKLLNNTIDFAESALGTPFFLSPEICQGLKYSFKSDVWMFGCTLYELLTFKKPFTSDCLIGLMKTILSNDVDFSLINEDYPECFRTLVKVCLNKDPENRPLISETNAIIINYTINIAKKLTEDKEIELIKKRQKKSTSSICLNTILKNNDNDKKNKDKTNLSLNKSFKSNSILDIINSYSNKSLNSLDKNNLNINKFESDTSIMKTPKEINSSIRNFYKMKSKSKINEASKEVKGNMLSIKTNFSQFNTIDLIKTDKNDIDSNHQERIKDKRIIRKYSKDEMLGKFESKSFNEIRDFAKKELNICKSVKSVLDGFKKGNSSRENSNFLKMKNEENQNNNNLSTVKTNTKNRNIVISIDNSSENDEKNLVEEKKKFPKIPKKPLSTKNDYSNNNIMSNNSLNSKLKKNKYYEVKDNTITSDNLNNHGSSKRKEEFFTFGINKNEKMMNKEREVKELVSKNLFQSSQLNSINEEIKIKHNFLNLTSEKCIISKYKKIKYRYDED